MGIACPEGIRLPGGNIGFGDARSMFINLHQPGFLGYSRTVGWKCGHGKCIGLDRFVSQLV
jgi:hypothetical protein